MKQVTPIISILILMLSFGSCHKDKITVKQQTQIVMGSPVIDNTKATINSLENLQNSGLEFGVYGYKTRETTHDNNPSTFDFTRLFNNTPVGISAPVRVRTTCC